jgi:hypothetical protein
MKFVVEKLFAVFFSHRDNLVSLIVAFLSFLSGRQGPKGRYQQKGYDTADPEGQAISVYFSEMAVHHDHRKFTLFDLMINDINKAFIRPALKPSFSDLIHDCFHNFLIT